jgi:phosphoribosylamine-glycine ligase
MTDGNSYKVLLLGLQARMGEGDTGLNFSGMGAISPVPLQMKLLPWRRTYHTTNGRFEEKILRTKFIFIGLMIVDGLTFGH